MIRPLCLVLCLTLHVGLGGGFVVDGVNFQLMPRSVRSASEATDQVHIRLHSRSNGWEGRAIDNVHHLQGSGFDPLVPSVILIHGFSESDTVGCAPAILEGFRQSPVSANVMVVDWSVLAAGPWYYTARSNSEQVGQVVAQLLIFLVNEGGADPRSLHLVGCSLGAKVAALAAANVSSAFTVGRLTGLDAWFGHTKAEWQLPTRHVGFVDVVHSDAGVLGHRESVGHADFFPNGGISPQPGCELANVFRFTNILSTGICSHSRAYIYFSESIRRPGGFLATPCGSWDDFRTGKCNAGHSVPMGFFTDYTARGNFYLHTNPKSPFGQSDDRLEQNFNHLGLADNEVRLQARNFATPSVNTIEDTRIKAGTKKNEARLWNHRGVNTLASFVRVAELNLVK